MVENYCERIHSKLVVAATVIIWRLNFIDRAIFSQEDLGEIAARTKLKGFFLPKHPKRLALFFQSYDKVVWYHFWQGIASSL